MKLITINEGQCLLDIATQHLGDASKSFAIALQNNISPTEELVIGNTLLIEDVAIENKKLVQDFADNMIVPASRKDDSVLLGEGVEFWAIEEEFIVS